MKLGRFFKYLVLVVIAVSLMIVAVVLLGSFTPQPTPLPNPNGYDDFVNAGQSLTGDASGYEKMTREQLTDLVSKNAEGLQLLHTGLAHESRMPDYYPAGYDLNLMNLLAPIKKSVFFLCAEGRLAELEGRTNDAAKLYIDGVRFGQNSVRGGVLISKLVGLACEAISLKPLDALNQSLDAKTSAQIAQTLEDIDAKAETSEDTLKQEKASMRQEYGLRGQFILLVTHKNVEASQKKCLAKLQANELHRRQVMLNFAERAYELDHGKRPADPSDLVPAYLKAAPKDPVTGSDLAVR